MHVCEETAIRTKGFTNSNGINNAFVTIAVEEWEGDYATRESVTLFFGVERATQLRDALTAAIEEAKGPHEEEVLHGVY
jgi:hypothetical protein